MPTFYEGRPIEILETELTRKDYESAYLLQEKYQSPFHRPAVKSGMCATAAVLIISALPYYLSRFSTIWAPVCGILIFVLLAVFFGNIQPRFIREWASQIFESNRLLSLKTTALIYRDSIICENEYEKFTEYWTDFSRCLEGDEYFVLSGGFHRQLLILDKKNMNEGQRQALSQHFANAFASRYHRVKG